MVKSRTDPLNDVALAEAAAWRVYLTEEGLETTAEFQRWLNESPANAAAWEDADGVWGFFDQQATAPELMDARRRALENARRHSHMRHRPRLFTSNRRRMLAASFAAIAGLASASLWRRSSPETYETALGERRQVTLDDGSVLTIDSGSLLKVRLGREARNIELVRGQARFDVAHDLSRPFSVKAGDRTVLATGTSFDVDLSDSALRVTLIEGRVVVFRDRGIAVTADTIGSQIDGVHLTAGEQFTAGKVVDKPQVVQVDLEKATSWESGKLIFDDEKLSVIIERVNRYSANRIVIADDAAANLTISGVFNAGDTEAVLSTLTAYLPVTVTKEAGGAVYIRSIR